MFFILMSFPIILTTSFKVDRNPSQGGQYCRITPLEEGVAPAVALEYTPPWKIRCRSPQTWYLESRGERHRIKWCHPPFPEGTSFVPSVCWIGKTCSILCTKWTVLVCITALLFIKEFCWRCTLKQLWIKYFNSVLGCNALKTHKI